MLSVARRPRTLAWMWHAVLAGDALLTRREASLLDLIERSDGVSDAPRLRAEVDAAAEDWAASQRGCLTIVNPSRPASFNETLEALTARGLLRPLDRRDATGGRPSKLYALTGAGRDAVVFARAMGRHLLDVTLDPAGRGARGLRELLQAGLWHDCGFVVVTTSGERCRAESLGPDGVMHGLLDDDPSWHSTVLTEVVRLCRGSWTWNGPGTCVGTFVVDDPDLVTSPCRVSVRTEEEPPGTRTTLRFEIPASPGP